MKHHDQRINFIKFLVVFAFLGIILQIAMSNCAKAEDYSSCYSVKKIKYIVQEENYYNPIFRCGKTTVLKDV